MNLLQSYRENLQKILSSNALSGMKVLLLDDECSRLIGMTFSLSKVLNTDIFLVRRLGDVSQPSDKSLSHLKAIIFLRPTEESVKQLCDQLRSPKYHEYHVFFVNGFIDEMSKKSLSLLQLIADVRGASDLIKQVHSFWFDTYVITPRLFSSDRPFTNGLYHDQQYWRPDDMETWQRSIQSLVTSMALLRTSSDIRYHKASPIAKLFAEDMSREMTRLRAMNSSLFSRPGNKTRSTVLIVDRMTDPITPLLQCWLYQSMIHEQIGIHYNRVDLSSVPNIREDTKEVVLACAPTAISSDAEIKNFEYDTFFSNFYFKNFGDVGVAIREEINKYGTDLGNSSKLDSIQDMQRFVDKFPQIRARANQVSKHVAILSELSRLNVKCSLMDSSEVEQKLACDSNHSEACSDVERILRLNSVTFENKLNIVMLYALKYENTRGNNITWFKQLLREFAPNSDAVHRINAIDEVLRLGGSTKRGTDIFGSKSVWSKVLNASSLRGVENVFTRHKPYMLTYLELLQKGKLSNTEFPLMGNTGSSSDNNSMIPTPDILYIYFVGGVTYEESATAQIFMESNPNSMNIFTGGTSILNSKMFKNSLIKDLVVDVETQHEDLTLDMFN